MEDDKVCEAHEEGRDGDEDVEKSRENVKEMDMESMMCVMQEVESKLSEKEVKPIEPHDIDHRVQGRNSDEDGLKETKPDTDGYGERERNHGSYNKGDEERHTVSQEIDVDGDIGDSVTKRMVGDPPVCTVREHCLHRSGYRELAGDMGQIDRGDLAAQGGIDPAESLDGLCQPKEYKAEMSYEKFPDTGSLAASCPEGNTMDYPYVDFSTSEFMVMCDFVAADDTQLSLSHGDKVLLLNAVTAEWWWVEHNGRCGYVPATHLRGVDDEEHSDIEDPWQDEEYYGSYKTLKLHLEMLSDQPRTQTYRNVIRQNSPALKGKRILDLGCGTGIISFFCAQLAEPEMVYAVEASEIAEQTRKLVDENGYSSIVQVLYQRAEELQLPAKVDVLVSEWMGTCLLFEFMLESVLLARDQWLKEDGVMWPSTARIHLVPCSADKEYASRVHFWDSPYGLDFSVLKPMAIQEFFSRPKPDYVLKPEDCLAQPCTLLDVNMKTLNIEDLERMDSKFHFHVDRDGTFHGFTAWFSVQFQNVDNHEQVELDTGPFNQLTHWKHTLFMLDKPMQVHSGDRITGSVVFKRNPIWRRHLSVTITWSISSTALTTVQDGCKVFPIWR